MKIQLTPDDRARIELDRELAESIDVARGLSDWEVEFVDSILRQIRREHRPLTDKQRARAVQIQEKLDTRQEGM